MLVEIEQKFEGAYSNDDENQPSEGAEVIPKAGLGLLSVFWIRTVTQSFFIFYCLYYFHLSLSGLATNNWDPSRFEHK